MTRGEKFIQSMSARGANISELRHLVAAGECMCETVCCRTCPVHKICTGTKSSAAIVAYFKEEA